MIPFPTAVVALVSPIACMLGHLLMALYYVIDQLPTPADHGVNAGREAT